MRILTRLMFVGGILLLIIVPKPAVSGGVAAAAGLLAAALSATVIWVWQRPRLLCRLRRYGTSSLLPERWLGVGTRRFHRLPPFPLHVIVPLVIGAAVPGWVIERLWDGGMFHRTVAEPFIDF